MRGFLGILLFILVALAAAAAGFQAGVMSNIGVNGAGYVWLWGFPHFGGFLFFLLIVGLLVFAFGGRRRYWGHHRYWGPGYGPMSGPMGDPDDPRRQWIAEAHRRLHEEEARGAAGSPAAGSPVTSSPSGPASPPDRPPVG